jgi:hypothetical protein
MRMTETLMTFSRMMVIGSLFAAAVTLVSCQQEKKSFTVSVSSDEAATFHSGDIANLTVQQNGQTTVFKDLPVIGSSGGRIGRLAHSGITVQVSGKQAVVLNAADRDRWAKITIQNQTPHPPGYFTPLAEKAEKRFQETEKEMENRRKNAKPMFEVKNPRYRLETSLAEEECLVTDKRAPGKWWELPVSSAYCENGLQGRGSVEIKAWSDPSKVVWTSTAATSGGGRGQINERWWCTVTVCVSESERQKLEALEKSGALFDAQKL